MAEEYTIFLRSTPLRKDRNDGATEHGEIHFIEASDEEEAKKKANELIRKLATWDPSWLREVTTIVGANRKIIYPSEQKQRER